MKPFIILKFADATYQVITELVVQHRARYMHDHVQSEYPTIEDAVAGTQKLFEDESEIRHWIVNNMEWSDLVSGCLMVDAHPERDLSGADWSFNDKASIPELPQGGVVDDLPLGILLARMLIADSSCDVLTIGDSVAVAAFQGSPETVQAYIGVVQQLAEQMKKYPNGEKPLLIKPEPGRILLPN